MKKGESSIELCGTQKKSKVTSFDQKEVIR